MSFYHEYTFVSPEPLFAEVKEKLRSYFASKALDDVMFPIWTHTALEKFGNSVKPIKQLCLEVCDYTVPVPCDFDTVRELWMTTAVEQCVPDPMVHYFLRDFRKVRIPKENCDEEEECKNPNNHTIIDFPDDVSYNEILVMNKTTQTVVGSYKQTRLLSPGNINTLKSCGPCCPNINGSAKDSFDIADGKIITTFSSGTIFLIYYAKTIENTYEVPLIPDIYEFKQYLQAFLTFKLLEQLSYQITDETFNQVDYKLTRAEHEKNEKAIELDIELKKKTVYQDIRSIRRSYNTNRHYIIR